MRVLVCLKQVPDSKSVDTDPVTGSLIRQNAGSIPNPADAYAISCMRRLKKEYGAETIALSMGPRQARSSLREALASGGDIAYHLIDGNLAGSDCYITAYALKSAVDALGSPEVILCGKESSDSDTGQVPGELAQLLGYAHVHGVIDIVSHEDQALIVKQRWNSGSRIIKVKLPVVFSIENDFGRYFSTMREKMESKRKPLVQWSLENLSDSNPSHYGYSASPTQVKKIFSPMRERKAIIEVDWEELLSRELSVAKNETKKTLKAKTKQEGSGDFAIVHCGDESFTRELIHALELVSSNGNIHIITSSNEKGNLEYYGDKIFIVSSCDDEDYYQGIKEILDKQNYDGVIFPADSLGLWLAPKLAATFGYGLTASCTDFSVEDGVLIGIRPADGDRLMAAISCKGTAMATVRKSMFKMAEKRNIKGEVVYHTGNTVDKKLQVIETRKVTYNEEDRDIHVIIGNGVKEELFSKVVSWAEGIGAQFWVTRPLVQAGLACVDRQIGVSGKAIQGKLAILLGVSGSRQTMTGLKQVDTIVAINEDEKANIFAEVDYGYIGKIEDII